ncbi:O-linked N-acetylglucosamine transferase, SPINDLY family protein [Thermoleptolyngbya sp. PKUAC-SCTB121]|uniref:O-linked N-acetylglucosamine transferase, SPINDLY family protein n=1 Tax=Thermoleptolyngbya sp. PKUAC-SCTB121 TaxID=2811482 RepID=UPI001962A0E8|nr:O-linked N-acetylglucosamine transferase, SPINDLY family protein [Thermoleptolyngbya sp. PKUAC-SCTB121]
MTELTLSSEPVSDSAAPVDSRLQEAIALVRAERYDAAAVALEQLIEENAAIPSAVWHLGLVRLLQKQEEEAQLLWTMMMSEAAPDQLEPWTTELSNLLHTEALRQQRKGQAQAAWLIRRHLREVNPADWQNALHLVELELELKQFQANSLEELGLIEWLRTEQPAAAEMEHLSTLVKQLLETIPYETAVIALVQAFIPRVEQPADWIDPLLAAAYNISSKIINYSRAIPYAELCHQIDPYHSATLLRLSAYYQDSEQYDKGIDFAERFLAGTQTTLQRWMGTAMLLRGLMIRGGQWERVTATLQDITALSETFLAEYEFKDDQLLDASILTASMYFYPYVSDSPRETRSLQNRVAKLYQDDLTASVKQKSDLYIPYPQAPLVRSVERKKLRVGYISRCMRAHSVGWLSRWLLHHHDHDRFDIHVLFNQQIEPGAFGREWFASKADSAYAIEGDILGIAKTIREDEIDILVDLDSITSDLNMGVLALKPAPVQVTWLGMDASGLPAVDYFIADSYVVPDDADEYYAETIWRLPQTYLAVDGFEVGVPTLRRDDLGIPSHAVIYLSAQIAYKRHPETVRRQMQILREVPNSYFLIKGAGDSESVRSLFLQIAEEEGVAGDRLRFLSRDKTELDHRANLAIADVVLDTFPYNGATTTMETLWMGIPMVTQVGKQFASRNSYGMMMNAGITEGIAHTPEEYVEWGVRLGKDAKLREEIQAKLRRSRQTSPLWNARQFTRDMERAYEQMWERYLEG